ncbi:MAG: hypothetical protein KKF12_05345 [Proteobacteria bacterium]|nr:hypothetical protein [Desulfobacula sp.]MBU3951450.1 hypothetical protein [Pseudomonadota bacterium]MBU4130225.1 hypothetical protein [Pseudomonadota bacterium]
MYYIYFPYVLVLSGLILYECYRKKHPKWWSLLVLFAPITTPYIIFKSRKTEGMILFMIFLATFTAMSAFEFYIYSDLREKNKYAHLPPITRQVIRLSDDLKQTTIDLDKALVTLEVISKVESRINELKRTIEFIETIRIAMAANQDAIDRLVKFITDYKAYFVKKDLNWVYQIQQFYTNRNVLLHYKSLNAYLDDFEALLSYTHSNFYNITKAKTSEHLNNYDEYYLRYRRAVDTHNKFNVQRIEFQNEFLLKYPDIKPYLPGKRQTDTFRLWE